MVRSAMRVSAVVDHFIDVSLHILPNLVIEAVLDGSLISRTRVLEPKGHGHVAVGSEGHDEELWQNLLSYRAHMHLSLFDDL